MVEIIFKEESYKIIGSCLTVYNRLGSGFLESMYQEALKIRKYSRLISLRIKFALWV